MNSLFNLIQTCAQHITHLLAMPSAARRAAAWACRPMPNVVVVMPRAKKCPAVLAIALSNVGMFGAAETFGPRSAWVRTCARVVVRERYAHKKETSVNFVSISLSTIHHLLTWMP